jgi:hypothetical protein
MQNKTGRENFLARDRIQKLLLRLLAKFHACYARICSSDRAAYSGRNRRNNDSSRSNTYSFDSMDFVV